MLPTVVSTTKALSNAVEGIARNLQRPRVKKLAKRIWDGVVAGTVVGIFVFGLVGCKTTGDFLKSLPLKSRTASSAGAENPYLASVPRLSPALQRRFDQALAQMTAGQWAAAESAWRDLAVDLPKASGVDLNLAITLMNQGKLAPALDVARNGIVKNPRNVELYNRAGLIARALGDFDAARSFYEQGIAQWANYAPLHLNLGILLEVYQGDLAPALASYESYQALQSQPDPKVAKWIQDLQRRVRAN